MAPIRFNDHSEDPTAAQGEPDASAARGRQAAAARSTPVDSPALRSPRRRWAVGAARVTAGLVLAGALLSLAAILALHWFILPHIGRWRSVVEAYAGAAVGATVHIGTLQVVDDRWLPPIELRDVQVSDPRTPGAAPALRLPRVVARLSPRALWSGELRLDFLRIEGADVEVHRDAGGRVHIAGHVLASTDDSAYAPNPALDWLLRQPSVTIDGGILRWTDALHGGAAIALTGVHAAWRNGLYHHDLDMSATPPADVGAPVRVKARFTQPLFAHAGDWRRWSGRIEAELPRVDLGGIAVRGAAAGLFPQLPLAGGGSVHAAVDFVPGAPRAASVDLALRHLAWPAIGTAEPLALDRLDGRYAVQRDGPSVVWSAQHAGFTLAAGAAAGATPAAWPTGDAALTLRPAGAGAGGSASSAHGELVADAIDLALLARIARSVPLDDAVRATLADHAPRGALRRVRYAWDGPAAAPERYRLRAQLQDVGMAARAAADAHAVGRPGVRNASGTVEATEAGGTAVLSIADGSVVLPGLLAEAEVPVGRFDGRLAWRIARAAPSTRAASPGVSVELRSARLSNADVRVEAEATWSRAAGATGPGHLQLDARIPRLRADRLARYLPVGIPLASRLYVAGALRSGELTRTRLRVNGGLHEFPFFRGQPPGDGTFHLTTHIDGATFAYVPSLPAHDGAAAFESGWPAFADVSGDLVFDRAGVQVHGATARWGGYALTGVEGRVDDIGLQPVLALQAHGSGPLADLIGYVNATPLGGAMGHALACSTATGPADLDVTLSVPLTAASSSTVVGTIALGGGDLRMAPGTPVLGNARGRIAFTERRLALTGGSAHVFGGVASIEGGNEGGGLRFTGSGVATAEGLRQAAELGWLSGVAQSLSGNASYRMALGFAQGQSELDVQSDLVGVASSLPSPLDKRAETPLPLHYRTALLPAAVGEPARDTLLVGLGNAVQAVYRRELPADAPPRVLSGAIGVAASAPALPASGVAGRAAFAEALDIDAWRTLGERWASTAAADGVSAPPGEAPAEPAVPLPPSSSHGHAPAPAPVPQPTVPGSGPLLGGYAPTTLTLQATQLRAGDRRIDDVHAELAQDAGLWRADVRARQVTGHIEYRLPRRAGGSGRLYARLSRLALPPSDASQVEQLLGRQPAEAQPAESDLLTSLPALDLAVDDFELRNKRLGRLEVEAVNQTVDGAVGHPPVREWRLQRLSLTTPEARFTAAGRWLPAGGATATALDLRIDMSDAGALLDRFGTPHAIAGGHGSLAGQISWAGSPLTPDTATMAGKLHLAVDDGRFLKVEPGAARLLGVLNLQALPRRLLLDFRDVFQQGFVFDSVVGDVRIDHGVASTNNLRMRGVQAAVLLEGEADIEHELQRLHVVVVPEVSAGTATLAYAVINPAIGLSAFLAQLFLHKPLAQAGTREFAISGSWSDPKVERLERSGPAAAALPASAPPPAAVPSEPEPEPQAEEVSR